ncbi:unnamed protein product, partial [Effrenium voratum]
ELARAEPGHRLRFALLEGSGPAEGWASWRLKTGKELLVRETSAGSTEPRDSQGETHPASATAKAASQSSSIGGGGPSVESAWDAAHAAHAAHAVGSAVTPWTRCTA